MNKRLFESMLLLCISLLILSYFIKIFLPNYFIMTITNENFLILANFIDEHLILRYTVSTVTSFITYYLFICACAKLTKIDIKGCIIILIVVLVGHIIYNYTSFGIHYGVCSMFLLAAVFNSNLKDTALIYTIHGLAQILSLNIRNMPLLVDQAHYAQLLIMMLDTYIWLVLIWIVQLQNKEVGIWEVVALRIMEMKSNFSKEKLKKQNQ